MSTILILSITGLLTAAVEGDTGLPTAVTRFLALGSAEKANDKDLNALSAGVFTEFIKADEPARGAAIRQLVEAFARATNMGEALLPYVLLHQLPVRKDELANAVAGRLFDANEEIARKWARVLCDRLGSESDSGYVDMRDFEARLGTWPNNQETHNIVRFLFQKSPSSALILFARHYVPGKEELRILVKERRITTYLLQAKQDAAMDRGAAKEAVQILSELATSEHAWVRLYVVEMMVQNSLLVDQKIVRKLAEDKDELVALSVRDLQNPKKYCRHRPIRAPWSDL